MNRRKIYTLIFFLIAGSIACKAQDEDKKFTVTGEPILRVFANYHMLLSSGENNSAFEVERAYIGYNAQVHPNFSIKINLDIGSPDDVSEYSKIRRYAYFKNAALTYKWNWLSTSFGLIDMTHFKLQEKFWGHRYIEKSFADRYRFGPSADLGWNFIASPLDYLSFDVTLSNGEGYNNLQRDNTLKLGVGTVIEPLKGLSIRLYGDIMEKSVIEGTFAGFVGYEFRKIFSIAAEYNRKFNASYVKGQDRYGYSIYGSYNFLEHFQIFGRYDWLTSTLEDNEAPWDIENDGNSAIFGLQYQPITQIKIAVSYRDWYPYAANLDNEAYFYLNLEYKF